MRKDLIINVLRKRLGIDECIIKEAYDIIENNKSPAIDDIFLSNIIASNMSISPTNAVNIAFEYNRIKNKHDDELKLELENKNNKKESKFLFLILGIVFVILFVIILYFSTHA